MQHKVHGLGGEQHAGGDLQPRGLVEHHGGPCEVPQLLVLHLQRGCVWACTHGDVSPSLHCRGQQAYGQEDRKESRVMGVGGWRGGHGEIAQR